MKCTILPLPTATYFRVSRNDPKAKSLTLRPQRHFIPSRLRLSKNRQSYMSVRVWASLKNQSRRLLAIFSSSLARLYFKLYQWAECNLQREKRRPSFCFWRNIRLRNRGDAMLVPSCTVKKVLSPKSKPALLPVVAWFNFQIGYEVDVQFASPRSLDRDRLNLAQYVAAMVELVQRAHDR